MSEPKQEQPTQKTQPKGKDKAGEPYEPVDIPVPKREDVFGILEKFAKPLDSHDQQ